MCRLRKQIKSILESSASCFVSQIVIYHAILKCKNNKHPFFPKKRFTTNVRCVMRRCVPAVMGAGFVSCHVLLLQSSHGEHKITAVIKAMFHYDNEQKSLAKRPHGEPMFAPILNVHADVRVCVRAGLGPVTRAHCYAPVCASIQMDGRSSLRPNQVEQLNQDPASHVVSQLCDNETGYDGRAGEGGGHVE